MQVPSRAPALYAHPVRDHAAASLSPPHYHHNQCAAATQARPPSGKSFTIDALLAKPEEISRNTTTSSSSSSCRTSGAPAVEKYLPAPPLVPLSGHAGLPLSYLYSSLHVHPQAGYSVYCCPPFSYQAAWRGDLYAQASMSKGSSGLHAFKAKGGKSKRMRTSFSSEQLSRLEKEFSRQQYMVGSERFLLASALQLTEAQVKVWFQNRRIKWRKQSLEQQQAKLAKLGLAAPPKSPGSQGHGDEGDEDEEFSDSDVDIDVSDDSAEPC